MSAIERVEFPTSMKELERRWAAVRKEMEARNIDALITQNSSDWLGGYVKWFTDVPAHNDYPRNVIFYRDDLMTVVEMGNKDGRNSLGGKDPLNPGVGEWVFSPSFYSVGYTNPYDGELVAAELKRRGCKTVGWVGKGRLQYDLVRVTEEQAGNVKFVDASDWVDRIKAIKSAEEIALIRRACAMQDAQWAAILPKIKPGMRDSELTALAQYEGELLGSQQGLFRCSSAPLGQPAVLRGRHYQGRVMQQGDYMTLLIENNGPGGHYAELARTFVHRQGVTGIARRLRGGGRRAEAHGEEPEDRRAAGRDLCKPQRLHEEPRRAAGDAAVRAQPGLRPGRAPAAALRRDHAARRQHEHGGASGLLQTDQLRLHLRQLPDQGRRLGRAPAQERAEDLGVVGWLVTSARAAAAAATNDGARSATRCPASPERS